MNITEIKQDKVSFECTVTVTAAKVNEKVDARLQELAKTAEIKGFRKGKVPVKILRTQYEDNVMGEVLEQSARDSVTKVVEDNKLRPADQPQISVKAFEKGGDLIFSISMPLLPEIKLMDISTIKVERTEVVVDAKEVDEAVVNMAKNFRDTKPIAKARKAKQGDVLVFDFSGTIAGESFNGGTAENYSLELGSGQFVPGFEEQLLGLNPGDEKEVIVTFPADYSAENLAGKEAVFACKVREIQEYVDTEIDDNLAKRLGLESLNELKENVQKQMLSDYENILFARVKRQVLDALAKGHTFDLPENLTKDEFNQIWAQFEQSKENGQISEEEASRPEEELRAEYQDIANRRVSLGLILAEIGNQNEIILTEEEITQAALQEASRYPGQEQQILELFKKDENAMASLRGPLYENKVVAFILEKADVTVKALSTDELVKQMEAEEKAESGDLSAKTDSKKSVKKTAKAKKVAKKKSTAKKSATKKSTTKKSATKKSKADK